MTEVERYTIENITGSTHHITDQHQSIAALAYANTRGIPRNESLAIIIGKQFRWLDWLAVTQREWQSQTRNHNKARHHDSIALREKYVRC